MDAMCPERHYWPNECQQCDTAWNALYFACQIAGHAYPPPLPWEDARLCAHCAAIHPEDRLVRPAVRLP